VTGTVGAAGVGVAVGLALMLPMEAGIPIPIPSDLVMLAVGARIGAGDLPLWAGVVLFEVVAVVATTTLFLLARGPGYGLIRRVGPRVGLTAARLSRATDAIERRGRTALMIAAEGGRSEIATLLLARGADPSLKDKAGKRAADLTSLSLLRERLTVP